MPWPQHYDPTPSWFLSAMIAALPILLLSGMLLYGFKARSAAAAGALLAFLIALMVFKMPAGLACTSAAYGACFGLMPIGWIMFSAVFLYNLTVRSGEFEIIKHSIAAISPDRRMQALLIAFGFGSFLEGCAGFGAPVAISAGLLIGLGFRPLTAAVLCLLANTAPVAFGSLGIPVVTLAKVTGLDLAALSQMVGRQLTLFSLILPTWLIVVMAGWRGAKGCWPALLVSGGTYAVIQLAASNYQGPALVNVLSGTGTMVALAIFLKLWHPKEIWRFPGESEELVSDELAGGASLASPAVKRVSAASQAYAWTPWLVLSIMVSLWSVPAVKHALDEVAGSVARLLTGDAKTNIEVPGLHNRVSRTFPAVPVASKPEAAMFECNILTPAGTAVMLAAVLSSFWLRLSPRIFFEELSRTFVGVRWALFTISCMLSLAFLVKYSGADVTIGLAFARAGPLYPFVAPLLGWVGVVVTGSDTSANAMFGSLQQITADRLGLSPILIAASNTTGGVMGKMVAAQSVVIAATATNQTGQESLILRRVLLHSLALAALVGLVTILQAHPLKWMVP